MGMDMLDGFKMYLNEINYTVAGRKIELIVEDEGDGPATAVTKARKLVAADKVHLMAGVFLTPAPMPWPPSLKKQAFPLL